jgi:ABC-type transport system substrate-binding protein
MASRLTAMAPVAAAAGACRPHMRKEGSGLGTRTLVTACGAAALTALLSLGGSPLAALPQAAAASRAAPHGEFTMDFTNDFPTLDPAVVQDIQSGIPMEAIYDTLVTYGDLAHGSTRITGDLASSWTVSKNGLTYTFHLRRGVVFSNGDPFTAQDVKFSLDRVTSYDATGPTGPSPLGSLFSDIVGYNAWFNGGKKPRASVTGLAGITTPNPYTVVIRLIQPQAYFLEELATDTADIEDPAVVQKYGPVNYTLHPVGTGPYKLLYWHRNQQMVLVPNPRYRGPTPAKMARVVFNVNIPASTELLQFKKGQNDMIYQPDAETYLNAILTPGLKRDYVRSNTNAIWYLALNVTKKPFNNVLVRRAVNLAINRAPILRLVNGRGTLMTQVLPPEMPGHERSLKGYPYNVKEAKKLLAEAGYRHGLSVTFVYTSGRPFVAQVVQNIQQQLSQVGIQANLKDIAQTGSYWPLVGEAAPAWNIAWDDWWQEYPDPQNFMYTLLDSQNIGTEDNGSYANRTFNALVQKADALPASREAERVKLYDEAQAIWYQDAPWVPLYYPVIDGLVQPWVKPHNPSLLVPPVLSPQIRDMWVTKG